MKEAKTYLGELKKINKLIDIKTEEIQKYYDQALNITARLDGERVSSSGRNDKMAEAVTQYVDKGKEISVEIHGLLKKKNGIMDTVERLPADEYIVIYEIYVKGSRTKTVADLCDKSESWVVKTHKKALRLINEMIN